MSVIFHDGRFCHIGEFNISMNINDLLSCHLQHTQSGQSVPVLFWQGAHLFCACSYGFGFAAQQNQQAGPKKSSDREVVLAWNLPLICAVEMKTYQPILESPVQKGLTFAVAKPQSAFFRSALRQLIEGAREKKQ